MTCKVCAVERCYVHCIYCGVDCTLDDSLHAVDCPHITGLYPADGELCWDCERPVGEYYTLRYAEGSDDVLCMSCGVCWILNG